MKKFFVSAIALLAACSLYAQDLTTVYNDAVTAFNNKDNATAAAGFEKLINEEGEDAAAGLDSEIATAKKFLPVCYQRIGLAAASKQDFDTALENLNKGAEAAELYGEVSTLQKINGVRAKVYEAKGATAFNDKDYATASEVFALGYAANPRNTGMALNLAMSYCELGELDKGVEVYEAVIALAAKNPDKYGEAAATATEKMNYYTTLKVAELQQSGDNDAIIAMAEGMLERNPESATAHKVRLQAYNAKKDYAKVIELGEAAANAQINDEDKSTVYYTLGLAYNAKEMKPQAIAALKQVTAGAAVEPAKAALAELTK